MKVRREIVEQVVKGMKDVFLNSPYNDVVMQGRKIIGLLEEVLAEPKKEPLCELCGREYSKSSVYGGASLGPRCIETLHHIEQYERHMNDASQLVNHILNDVHDETDARDYQEAAMMQGCWESYEPCQLCGVEEGIVKFKGGAMIGASCLNLVGDNRVHLFNDPNQELNYRSNPIPEGESLNCDYFIPCDQLAVCISDDYGALCSEHFSLLMRAWST